MGDVDQGLLTTGSGPGESAGTSLLTDGTTPGGNGDNRTSSGSEGTTPVTKRENLYGYEKMFSPEYQGHPALDGLDEPNKLAKSYIELKGKVGRAVNPPAENATEEERYDFLRKAGIPTRPQSQEDYSFSDPPDVPKSDLTWFKTLSYSLGLSNEQADAIQSQYRSVFQAATNAITERKEATNRAANDAMRLQMGDAAYTRHMELANRGLNQFVRGEKNKDVADFVREMPAHLKSDPRMHKLFASIAAATTEGRSPITDGQNTETASTGKQFKHLDQV